MHLKILIGIIKAHRWPWVTWLSLKCPLSSVYLSLVKGALQGRVWGGSCQELLRPKYLEAVRTVPSSSVRKGTRKVGYKRNQRVNLLAFFPGAKELSAWGHSEVTQGGWHQSWQEGFCSFLAAWGHCRQVHTHLSFQSLTAHVISIKHRDLRSFRFTESY